MKGWILITNEDGVEMLVQVAHLEAVAELPGAGGSRLFLTSGATVSTSLPMRDPANGDCVGRRLDRAGFGS